VVHQLEKLDNAGVLKLFLLEGQKSKDAVRRLAPFYPFIAKHKLHKTQGCSRIHEFAAKAAGASRKNVQQALDIHRNTQDKPGLRDLFDNGLVSLEKLDIASRVAQVDDETQWCERVQELSVPALRTLANEAKAAAAAASSRAQQSAKTGHGKEQFSTNAISEETATSTGRQQAGLFETPPTQVQYTGLSPFDSKNYRIDILAADRFERFRMGLQSNTGRTISFSDALGALLDEAAHSLLNKKFTHKKRPCTPSAASHVIEIDAASGRATCNTVFGVVEFDHWKLAKCLDPTALFVTKSKTDSGLPGFVHDLSEMYQQARERAAQLRHKAGRLARNVPTAVKRYLKFAYGGVCAVGGCNKLASVLHHRKRYANDPDHDPDNLAPLCRSHHELIHAELCQNENEHPRVWRFSPERKANGTKQSSTARIDAKVRAHRKLALHKRRK